MQLRYIRNAHENHSQAQRTPAMHAVHGCWHINCHAMSYALGAWLLCAGRIACGTDIASPTQALRAGDGGRGVKVNPLAPIPEKFLAKKISQKSC